MTNQKPTAIQRSDDNYDTLRLVLECPLDGEGPDEAVDLRNERGNLVIAAYSFRSRSYTGRYEAGQHDDARRDDRMWRDAQRAFWLHVLYGEPRACVPLSIHLEKWGDDFLLSRTDITGPGSFRRIEGDTGAELFAAWKRRDKQAANV